MGSPADEEERKDDEGPQFQVKIEPFWMAKYEITWEQMQPFLDRYKVYKESQTPNAALDDADAISFPTPVYPQEAVPIYEAMGWKGKYPVADMAQIAARQYTKWLSKKTGHFYRLPTEAEWEYAARAGTSTPYSYGDSADDLGEYAWYFDNSEWDDPDRGHPKTFNGYREVGQKKPNPWGLYDMHGNVAEWVIDQYDPSHYKKFAGKTVDWREVINWPTTEYPRVVRGGHYDSDAFQCRSASRLGSSAAWKEIDPQKPKSIWWHTSAFFAGFRIIRPVNEPAEAEKLKFWEPDYADAWNVLKTSQKEVRQRVTKSSE
jgi:formylglycine-generating enzyme required for sulfatase activity